MRSYALTEPLIALSSKRVESLLNLAISSFILMIKLIMSILFYFIQLFLNPIQPTPKESNKSG